MVTRYKATEEEIRERHPDAEPVPWTEEVREVGAATDLSASHVARGGQARERTG
jgi:hypothetical protein